MATTIMLDANALSKLIELSGEEFKLKLSQAVLTEAVNRYVRVNTQELEKLLGPTFKEAIDGEMRRIFGFFDGRYSRESGPFKPSEKMTQAIKSLVRDEVGNSGGDMEREMRVYATEQVEQRLIKVKASIDTRIEAAIAKGIDEVVKARVAEKLAAIMAAAQG